MPVAIGNELKLQDNKVSAYYDNLFRKLNVAKAWTNTTTTESGGTVTVLNNGEILDNISSEYSNWYCPEYSSVCVINKKLFRINNRSIYQIGTDENWKQCSRLISYNDNQGLYAINELNELYFFDNVSNTGTYISKTKISSPSTNWVSVKLKYGICNGYLYKLDGVTATKVGTLNGWQKIADYASKLTGICNGVIYQVDETTETAISSDNNFVDVAAWSINNGYAINTSGELFYISNGSVTKSEFNETVKQIYASPTGAALGDTSIITTNGKLYYGQYDTWYELGSGITWSWATISKNSAYVLAIGNGKLYKIVPNTSGGTSTQIGTSSGYKRIYGETEIVSGNNTVALAWTGNATHNETTIYTTQHPQRLDKTYSDLNLTQYGTVTAYTGSTITSNSKVFDSDISKNGSFTLIPPATIHETVSVADILRATE